jgi:hypothetical protein
VRVRHTDNIQNLLFFQQTNSYTVHINIMLHLQCLSVYIFIVTRIQFCEC